MAIINLIDPLPKYQADVKNALTVFDNSQECYRFSTDMDRIDEMIEWIFKNTHSRFVLLGTDRIYFESEEDAMAFKLGWL